MKRRLLFWTEKSERQKERSQNRVERKTLKPGKMESFDKKNEIVICRYERSGKGKEYHHHQSLFLQKNREENYLQIEVKSNRKKNLSKERAFTKKFIERQNLEAKS